MDRVLCLIETEYLEVKEFDNQEIWMDLEPIYFTQTKIENVVPLYNHPHSDRENGQKEVHYHIDTRYTDKMSKVRINLPLKQNERLEYKFLEKLREEEIVRTPVNFISKSKLKYNCIHKGKCPHRGFDLSNVEAINGVITCPLHSLKFDVKTKKIINA